MRAYSLRSLALIILAITSLISGCAGTVVHMRELAVDKAPVAPAPGKAAVVFLRPSGMGFAIQSSVFEVKGNQSLLVGIIAAKTKVAYQVEPGKRLFMAIGESADFMTADLLPNRTYYVIVAPRMGLWKARFGLEPVRATELNSPEFKSSLADCRWVEKTDASENWARDNMASIESKRAEYYPDWVKQPEPERPNLSQGDGR
jgi:hypothetical protein